MPHRSTPQDPNAYPAGYPQLSPAEKLLLLSSAVNTFDRTWLTSDTLRSSEKLLMHVATSADTEFFERVVLHFKPPSGVSEIGEIILFTATKVALERNVAITTGNDIWFPRPLNTARECDLDWLTHEVTHVVDYSAHGKDEFVRNYVREWLNTFSYQEILPERKARLFAYTLSQFLGYNPKITELMSLGLDSNLESMLKDNLFVYSEEFGKLLLQQARSNSFGQDLRKEAEQIYSASHNWTQLKRALLDYRSVE